MKKLKIDGQLVLDCYDHSFLASGDPDSMNNMLQEDKLAEERLGIYLHPAISINSMTYRGYIEGKDVEDAICASFIKQPEVCRNITATALVEELTFSS